MWISSKNDDKQKIQKHIDARPHRIGVGYVDENMCIYIPYESHYVSVSIRTVKTNQRIHVNIEEKTHNYPQSTTSADEYNEYYTTLGLPSGASYKEIRKAYLKLVLEHHPDKGGDKETFQEISHAYELLCHKLDLS